MSLISQLINDHRNVDDLFNRFEHADGDDHDGLAHLRDLIVEHLAIHAEVEEQTLYPALREAVPEAGLELLEALEEHHAVKATLAELERMGPSHERFRAKMKVVIDNVRHHVEEEEGDDGLFAIARKELKQPQLEEMAERATQLRAMGPTRPHPLSPDQPPLNLVVGLPIAIVDRTVTTLRKVIDRTLIRR